MPEILTHDGLTMIVERPEPAAGPAPEPRPPVLLVHGLFGGGWVFDRWQRHLADRGWTSYALNLRGHHDSRPVADLGQVSLEDYVADVRDAAARLAGEHGAKPVVVGHSMGGLLAQKLAEGDAVQAAVFLCAAAPRGVNVLSPRLVLKMLPRLGALFGSRPIEMTYEDDVDLALNRVAPDERAALHARMVADSGRATRELAFGSLAVDARRVTCPTIAVGAADDRFVAPAVAKKVASKYHAPHWQYAGHAHFLVQEPGWEGPAGDVERWLAHVVDRLRTPHVDETLWRDLKNGIGDLVELTFFDGYAVRAELVSVDLAARQYVVYAPIEQRRPGARERYLAHEKGEEEWSPLVEITNVRHIAA